MSTNTENRCRICGRSDRALSFEHVPPRSSFNRVRVRLQGIMDWLRRSETGKVRGGKYLQRGAGFAVLCRDCNSKLGRWYVREYTAWTHRGIHVLRSIPSYADANANPMDAAATIQFHKVRPLLFLKQVAAMILAVNRAEVGDTMPELRSFVLDPKSQSLPDRYAFYLALYRGPSARYCGLSGTLNIETHEQHFFSEMAYIRLSRAHSAWMRRRGC
jgi:hypothetical protein